jgi:ABC-2 type transport system permease protein
MSDVVVVQQLWWREMRQMFRRPLRIASLLIQPMMWLIIFGLGVGRGLGVTVNGVPYILFILPGILGMKMLYSSSRAGVSVLRDRQAGFLKEVFVAPVSRMGILLGVASGVVSRALLQGMLLLGAGYLVGLRVGWAQVALLLLTMALVGFGLIMIAIAVAWYSEDASTFGSAANFVIFPLFLLSGAIFPLDKLPEWLLVIVKLNPLTYGVDALRQIALGEQFAQFPLYLDLAIIVSFVLIGLSAGSMLLRRASESA